MRGREGNSSTTSQHSSSRVTAQQPLCTGQGRHRYPHPRGGAPGTRLGGFAKNEGRKYPLNVVKKDGEGLFTEAAGERTRRSGFKVKEGRFGVDVGREFALKGLKIQVSDA